MFVSPVSRMSEVTFASTPLHVVSNQKRDSIVSCAPCCCTIFSWIWNFFTSLFCCFKKDTHWQETQDILKKGEYTLNGIKYRMATALNTAADQTVQYNPCKMTRCIPYQKETQLQVTKQDFIDLACKQNKVAIIHHTPLDGELCYRSGLSLAHERKKELFPLKENAVVFSPLVPIFRHGEKKNYALMESLQKASIITSIESDEEQRIWNEFFVAFENYSETVVLAISGNISPHLYMEVLQKFFPGTFKKVIFAILDKRKYTMYSEAIKKLNGKICL